MDAEAEDEAPALAGVRVGVPLRWAGPAVALVALSGMVLVALSFRMPAGAFLSSFVAGMGVATVASFVAPRFFFVSPRFPLRRCTVTRDGIFTRSGAPLLTADLILGFEIEQGPRGHVVRAFDRRLDVFEIRPAHVEDARLAARLLFGARARGRGVVAVPAQPWATTLEATFGVGTVAAVLFATLALWGPLLIPFAVLLAFVAMAATPTRVVAGDDAVHIRWLARRVTLPIATITRASADTKGVTLHAEGGTRFFAMPAAAAHRFRERVEAALDASRIAARSELVARLDRGGRSLETWVAALRAIGSEGQTYRFAAPPRDALVDVVCDVNRRPIDRVAAAIALAATDRSARAVIDGAARATADPELRRAFAQVAQEGDVDTKRIERLDARDRARGLRPP